MADHLTSGAQHLERLMADLGTECELRRPDVPGTYVAGTNVDPVPVNGAAYYTGPCLINEQTRTSATTESSGQDRTIDMHRGRIGFDPDVPVDIRPGDICEITAARNPGIVGDLFTIVDVRRASVHASRQFGMRSITRSPKVE